MAPFDRPVRSLALVVFAALAACSSPMTPGDGAADARDGSSTEAGDVLRTDAADVAPVDVFMDGGDGGDACADGSMCGTSCADLQTDPVHCGSCTHDCTHLPGVSAADVHCVAGACSVTGACLPGRAHCSANPDDGCEVDTTTPAHCGSCGVTCSEPTPACSADSTGAYHCESGCGGSTPTRCGAMCVDTQTNPQYCGNCTTACPTVTNGQATCASGTCGFDCLPGFADCDGIALNGCEVDTRVSPTACGACGTVCTVANGAPGCAAGMCTVASCNAGFADCNGTVSDGCEASTSNSTANCGACGTACTTPNATPACVSGVCTVMTCNAGFADCNGSASDGCEVNINTSAANCGSCGNRCMVMDGVPACTMGVCGVSTCSAGFGDCNGMASDGCETNLDTSVANCGACASPCSLAHTTQQCTAGACVVGTCDPGFADCDGIATNGCEVNITNSPTDCGGCGMACTTANGAPGCAAGACTVGRCNPGFGDCDGMVANGCEVNTRTSVTDCGACGAVCTVANGAGACSTGLCTIGSCNTGFADCNGSAGDGCEVDLGSSPAHCGSCANACALPNAMAGCAGGTCTVASCSAGFADCNGNPADGCEVDIANNPLSCGACGRICFIPNGAAACMAGACAVAACAPGFADCDGLPGNGCEANLASDPANCSACGSACSVPNATASCSSGTCGIGTCNAGFADCDTSPGNGCETNTGNSISSCGTCGHVCSVPNAVPTCTSGACTVGSCNTNFADCDGAAANGCEANLQSTVTACGSCGNACTAANGFGGCVGGMCTVASCSSGFADCNGAVGDGCEVNTNTTATNCGACGMNCVVPNATPACVGGTCRVGTCNTGFGDCDGNPANGCETNLNTSVNSCGTCGNVCSTGGGTPVCTMGTCGISSCSPGFGDCNMSASDGCETNTNTSVSNCGACRNVCVAANGTSGCAAGACTVASCNPGFGNCDNNPANGCEVNLNTNTANCGMCGRPCVLPNAAPACTTGTCAVASCNPGFANCNSTVGDGCEVNVMTDPNNCGGCGTRCSVANGTGACSAGVCTIAACSPGFANCDGNVANGCEVFTNGDRNNCGGCGRVCFAANGTAGCSGGTCTVASCNSGFANCNNNPADGCEINTTNNVNNCGYCGNVCSVANGTSTTCSSSTCQVTSCNAGFGNCNGNPLDGCETNLNTSNFNCGSCGNACNTACMVGVTASSATCGSGVCRVTGCIGGRVDVDGVCSDGCECAPMNSGGSCFSPRSIGMLSNGGSTTFTANLVPTGTEVVLQVSFNGNVNSAFHPRITFTSNPGAEFLFDVYAPSCSTPLSCGSEGGSAIGKTDWETFFTGPDPFFFTNPVPNPSPVLIRVYRRAGAATTCNTFTLRISN